MTSKSPYVVRSIPIAYDLGNLAVADSNPLELPVEGSDSLNSRIQELARDNVQLLVNNLLQLPVKRTADSINSSSTQDSSVVLFQLPEPLWPLPREKPLPKAKPLTKWEKFAKEKGIRKKTKDGKLVFDEEAQKWVPKWGYGGINKKLDNQWLVEVDDQAEKAAAEKGDDLIDPRKLKRDERKKLVKRNMLQQKRNAKKLRI